MRQGHLFVKTRKENPEDEISEGSRLLSRAGFVHKEMSGAYTLLPLGLMSIDKIVNIIKEEMFVLGALPIHMTALQNKELWQKTNRWDDSEVDIWFKTKLKNENEIGLGFTHEEPVTNLMRYHIRSYKDLPVSVFQIQNKFRNEIRAKSGILRCREFLMKDLYSFSKDEAEHNMFYDSVSNAYFKIFERLGLGHLVYKTFASGGVFSKYSHEFQAVCDIGEDTIYVDKGKRIAINEEVLNEEVLKELNLNKDDLEIRKSVEIGNIFSLGFKFSTPLSLNYKDEKGEDRPVYMGSYGIGPTRILGLIAEMYRDERGLIWPESVAPFDIHILSVGTSSEVNTEAEKIYHELKRLNFEVLYDDRDIRAGEKFAEADLLGIPWRLVVSEKSLKEDSIEIKKRDQKEALFVKKDHLLEVLRKKA